MTLLMRDRENIEKGIEQGIEQGIGHATRKVAIAMLKKGMDTIDIMDVTGYTEDEILSLRDELGI